MVDQPGFFDLEGRLGVLSKTGDPLERLARVVDFEIFLAEPDLTLPVIAAKLEEATG